MACRIIIFCRLLTDIFVLDLDLNAFVWCADYIRTGNPMKEAIGCAQAQIVFRFTAQHIWARKGTLYSEFSAKRAESGSPADIYTA